MAEHITFWLLAALTLIPAVMVVTARNILHAGLWLLPTLLGVAGFFLVLGSDFLAAVQVLIYVGGIMVLLLFALLLTRRIADPEATSHNQAVGWSFLFSLTTGVILIWATVGRFGASPAGPPPSGSTERIGEALLGPYLLPFEVASVLLLAAIIGAIVVARGERR